LDAIPTPFTTYSCFYIWEKKPTKYWLNKAILGKIIEKVFSFKQCFLAFFFIILHLNGMCSDLEVSSVKKNLFFDLQLGGH